MTQCVAFNPRPLRASSFVLLGDSFQPLFNQHAAAAVPAAAPLLLRPLRTQSCA